MYRIRALLGNVVDVSELTFHAVAAIICWWTSLSIIHFGRNALEGAGMPPTSIPGLMAAAMSPDITHRILGWAEGVPSVVVGAILAFSAAEGTWWIIRRISGRT